MITLERKTDDETSFRLRSEDDIRKWFEQKFAILTERVNQEDRTSLDRERRMMQQLQEGLITMGEIVKNVKEQNSIGLNEVHTLSLESLHSLQ